MVTAAGLSLSSYSAVADSAETMTVDVVVKMIAAANHSL
jgi:hypothetical protein